jgi:hypothetical protein
MPREGFSHYDWRVYFGSIVQSGLILKTWSEICGKMQVMQEYDSEQGAVRVPGVMDGSDRIATIGVMMEADYEARSLARRIGQSAA